MSAFREFSGPSALDLLTEFRRKLMILVERRMAELRGERSERDAYEEYESLRYFEQELNRLIAKFADEARAPLIELLSRIGPWNTSTAMRPALQSLAQDERLRDAADKG